MSVSDRFTKLLGSLQPTDAELARYESHQNTVGIRLTTVFPGTKVERIGSHARGSAIVGASDLDLLAIMPTGQATRGGDLINSDTLIRKVRDQLSARYGGTEVGKDGVAVVVQFAGGGYSVDVVPAVFGGMEPLGPGGANRPVYSIPDGSGGWLRTAPKAHGEYIGAADASSRGKLKYTAQIMKFWCGCRSPRTPLLSFHLELLLAAGGVCTGAKSYAQCVADTLFLLADRDLAGLRDPLGISGVIAATKTGGQRSQAFSTVLVAAERAGKAIEADNRGRFDEACRLWSLVFNGSFPNR